jgi:phosphomannomutase
MVITASHNPQQWNGLKCLLREPEGLHRAGACAPPKAIADAVIARFRAGGEVGTAVGWEHIGSYERREDAATDVHIGRVHAALNAAGLAGDAAPAALGRGLKIAVDCVNASSVRTAPEFLRSLGCEVVALNTRPSGLFPHPPEPTEANLSGAGGLREAVLGHRCHAGFALDPDADRVAILDAGGRYIGEEYTLALGAQAILGGSRSEAERPVLVTNLSTSRMLEDVGERAGARVVRTPVGEANVVEAMKREGAIAGGEGNGGVIWPRSCYVRDTLAAMGLVVSLMALRRKSVAELVAEIPAYAIEKRKVDLAGKEHAAAAVAKVAQHFREHRVDTRDGAWVGIAKGALADRAWVHVRASNTEPILRLIAEAPSAEEARRLLDEAARAIGA